MRYLVYNNPEGDVVDFVRGNDNQPLIFNDLGEAENCADEQDNGYVVPMGWNPIDALERLRAMGEKTTAWQLSGVEPTEDEVNALIQDSTELSVEFAEVLGEVYEDADTEA